ncbi:MAG: deoxyribonuclease IV [Candidatus Bathyarchaeota archaeon]|nr:deoxyribonuclease IV [Candidatus Bathyarchaeota archaeon]
MKVGIHVSISGSIDLAIDRALERRCDTFQIFTRNPRGWKFKTLSEDDVKNFTRKLADSGIAPAVSHMPYLPNLASPKEDVYEKSVETLTAEVHRCGLLNIPYLVTHLGSHLGAGMELGYRRIVDACNEALSEVENDVIMLLENTAGTKNSMGGTFKAIRHIIDGVEQKSRVAVCFDTCHAFAAGYDLRNEKALSETLERFDEVIGLDLLRVVHLNDSKGDLGSQIDRHEHIGLGFIGEEGFKTILRNETIRPLPLILETPIDKRRDDYGNLEKVRELAKTS